MFDAERITQQIIDWIRDFFENNGKDSPAVVGISGGKDSSVVAALCVRALGADRVIGVLMPNGEQHDIDMSHLLVSHLGIKSVTFNIRGMYEAAIAEAERCGAVLTEQARVNIQPRIRMTVTYLVSQCYGGRVANTCNLSEDYVGYATRYGDGAGDFSPLSHLTVQEVKQIGRALGLPDVLVDKPPIDGLCGRTDEDNLGFSYAVLDRYIREGVCDDPDIRARIDQKHRSNLFKLQLMPAFPYNP